MIGLTGKQEGWVRNAAQEVGGDTPSRAYFKRKARDKRFDSAVRRAITEGRPLSAELQRKVVDSYRSGLLRVRGEAIGRTEAVQALNAGNHTGVGQAIERGRIAAENVIRTWYTSADERVRGSHRPMHGQKRQYGVPFDLPSGSQVMYPGDTSLGASGADTVNERCSAVTEYGKAA